MDLTSDISDITWADMTAAGLDIDLIRRTPTSLGVDEYILTAADVRVAFGPAVDMEDGGTIGWAVAAYDRGEDGWDLREEHHEDSGAAALARVARLGCPR